MDYRGSRNTMRKAILFLALVWGLLTIILHGCNLEEVTEPVIVSIKVDAGKVTEIGDGWYQTNGSYEAVISHEYQYNTVGRRNGRTNHTRFY